MPEGITKLCVWYSSDSVTCMAYTNKNPAGEMKHLSDAAAYYLAQLVHMELLNGNGSVRPFLCEGAVGWHWEAEDV